MNTTLNDLDPIESLKSLMQENGLIGILDLIKFYDICDTMSNQAQWRPKIEKQVKVSEKGLGADSLKDKQ